MANNREIQRRVNDAIASLNQIKVNLYNPLEIKNVNKAAILQHIRFIKKDLNMTEINELLDE